MSIGAGNDDQTYFDDLITAATGTLAGNEVLLANVSGERTDFIRLNNSEVRQAGTVDQRTLTVDLIEAQRHTGGSIRLSGDRSVDDARLATLLAQLREQRAYVADDPFLLYNTEPTSTERVERGRSPSPMPHSPRSARRGRAATSSGSTPRATRSRGSPTASGNAIGSNRRRSISTGASTCAPTKRRRTSTPGSTGTTTRSRPRSTGRPAR